VQIGGESRTCFACLTTSLNRRSNPGCSSWILRKFLVMIPSSQHYRESIFIHYSYITFYTCSFPHNNIHTFIMYIFKVSISMCKCSYDSILLYSYIYSIHVKAYRYCLDIELLLSNFQLLLSNFEPLLSNFQLLLSKFELLLSNFQLLLSNYYCLIFNCYCPTLNCYCPTITV
jgi:hypothetical protein